MLKPKSPIITVLVPLSYLTINVYDFYIIMYFHLGQIMQNKANFGNSKMNINICITMNYVILSHLKGRKNKPNSKPIKPITNPIKANTNPIKPITNPILPAYKGALKYKNDNVIILRIEMKNGLLRVSK